MQAGQVLSVATIVLKGQIKMHFEKMKKIRGTYRELHACLWLRPLNGMQVLYSVARKDDFYLDCEIIR